MAKKKNLVIVESPAKARTLEKFLGKGFEVRACGGHIRDLPPQRLGVNIDEDFEPTYITIKGKSEIIKLLKTHAKKAEKVYLAPDPDREGEAIAWHLKNALGRSIKVKRIEFNEITKAAVQEAVEHPREIDKDRVDAQQARRVLDRLVGYKISPILWKKIRKGLSAGRVQSVAVRLICDREKAIRAFKPEEYWKITAKLSKEGQDQTFEAKLFSKGNEKIKVTSGGQANKIVAEAKAGSFDVTKVVRKEQKRHSAPPFITSTLQQEAARKLGFSAKKTMSVAQRLYEGVELKKSHERVGLITYMRTDSFRLAAQAIGEVRKYIAEKHGKQYLPAKPAFYKRKKQAQDAHEAIRPTSVFRTPDAIKDSLSLDQYKLYLLIWNRFVACQMKSAVIDQTSVDIDAAGYTFRATGSIIKFDGFMTLYIEGKDEEEEEKAGVLPDLSEGDKLNLLGLLPTQHFTQPPPRYSEATLVKELEQKGIGRPSTYAPIMATVESRGYVKRENKYMRPTKLGETINQQMVLHFPRIVDVSFTAHMEDDLDDILEGKVKWRAMLADFYGPFAKTLEKAKVNMKKIKKEKMLEEKCPDCGKNLMIRDGRYGEFIACSGFPKCRYTRAIEEKKTDDAQKGETGATKPVGEVSKEMCDKCGKPMVMKRSRYGAFLACSGYPKCKNIKSIVKEIGIDCPDCGGKLIERRSRRGKIFYGCSNYPKCKFGLWSKPTGEKCPKCGSLLVDKVSKGHVVAHKCSNKECDYLKNLS